MVVEYPSSGPVLQGIMILDHLRSGLVLNESLVIFEITSKAIQNERSSGKSSISKVKRVEIVLCEINEKRKE